MPIGKPKMSRWVGQTKINGKI